MSAVHAKPLMEIRKVIALTQRGAEGIDRERWRYAVSPSEWYAIDREVQDIGRGWNGRAILPHHPPAWALSIYGVELVIDERLERTYRLKDYEVSG